LFRQDAAGSTACPIEHDARELVLLARWRTPSGATAIVLPITL
jgi:hypothetical protein